MNLSCALVFLFIVNIASGYTICRDWTRWWQNEDPTRNIFGGTPIKADGDFPYLVSIRLNGHHFCGGSILNERYILTAAHCFEDRDNLPNSIQYGKVKIHPRGPNVVSMKRVITHENYYHDENRVENDIALIELQEDIKFGKHASPVSLPYQNEDIPETNNMLIMGWGLIENETYPLHGRYTEISKFPDSYCITRGIDIEDKYCGGITKAGRGTCYADSGGPVMIDGKQYGIVSGSDAMECGTTEHPEFYTRVPAYRVWINKHIGV